MKKIDDEASVNNVVIAFQRVFKSNDPFSDAYNSTVDSKLLLFRTDGYFLTEFQFAALKEAIKTISVTND